MAPRLGGKVLLHTVVLSLFICLSICTVDDINCLKSIKDSLDDPHNSFKFSWNFDNNTEGFLCRFDGVECWQPDENKVLNIRLSNMGLKGQFPLGIEKCRSLVWLDLSGNELSGPIPSNISKVFPYGTALDLSSNRFSGNIPKQISNCRFLNELKLHNNQLTGPIPPELSLLRRLKVFSVSNNQLYGPVPALNINLSESSYAGNPGLCGFPLEPCNIHSKANFAKFFRWGFTIGYLVSIVSVISISMCAPWVDRDERNELLRKLVWTLISNRKTYKRENSHESQQTSRDRETSVWENLVSRVSYSELSEATNNFSAYTIIGFGQMGTTFKATLPNGWHVAVKRLCDTQRSDEHFIAELKILGRLRHDNLVSLLGFCIESKEKLLVYKYMSNGNLYDWLHPAEGEAKFIDWPLRVKIAHGVARGLVWLHHNPYLHLVHLDISSKCILLDRDFEPKISNFGEAIFKKSNQTDSNISLHVGSEFWLWDLSFVKEDVYRFGVLLLELITGEDPSKLMDSSNAGDESLSKWVVDISESTDFHDLVDKSLVGRGFDLEIFEIFRVACDCVRPSPDNRPTMFEVHKTTREVSKRYGIEPGPELTTRMGSESNEAEITEI